MFFREVSLEEVSLDEGKPRLAVEIDHHGKDLIQERDSASDDQEVYDAITEIFFF